MGMRSQGEEVTFTIEEGNSGEISVRSQCASVQLVDYGKNRTVALSEQAQAFFDFATSADAADLIRTAGAVPVNE